MAECIRDKNKSESSVSTKDMTDTFFMHYSDRKLNLQINNDDDNDDDECGKYYDNSIQSRIQP